jgi:hypothetical protein
MPIQLLRQREPFARDPGSAEIIRGAAYWRLKAALEKYCRGRSSGRSFVVSGNRGAGKTTMVLAVVQDLIEKADSESRDVRRTSTRQDRDVLCRPLLVKLSGPDIVRERMRPPVDGSPRSASGNDGSNGANGHATAAQQAPETENLLRHLARALHLALAAEFSRRFEQVLPRRATGEHAELLEAWAQLTLELNEGAKVQTLRRFWELARSFRRGVLFDDPVETDRQGLCELMALDVSADAYRIAIGDVKRQVKLALTEKGGEKEVPLSDELRKFAAPLTGIVGGAATGVGVFQMSGPAGLGTTLGAVAAALLSMLVLTAALAPKRTRNDTETLDFSPDTSVGSLVWRLGRSIDLLFRAGLAPVFVIDELDKTPDTEHLGSWIGKRAQELKSLLTERAFFCFLTGREYAEKMHSDRLLKTYPPEYTQFSDYLFVNYLPSELHTFLRDLMQLHPVAIPDAAAAQQEDRLDAILPFLVLFRAEMHPIDIRRQLNAMITDDDVVRTEAGPLRNIDRIQLLYQLAAEYTLARDNIEPRVRDDPRFALLALDAVYYAARQWPLGAELDISEQAVTSYLNVRRMPETKGSATDLTKSELRLLQSCVFTVVELLQDPTRMRELLEEDWFQQRMSGAPGTARDPVVVARRAALIADTLPSEATLESGPADAITLLHWRFDVHGLPSASKDQLALARQALDEFAMLRQEVHEPLVRMFGAGIDWLEGASIFLAPIHWSHASEMRARLERGTVTLEYPDMLTDALTLREYVGVVVAALPAVCRLLALTRVLAAGGSHLVGALGAASSTLQLYSLSNEESGRRITAAWSSLADTVDGASNLAMSTAIEGFGARLEALVAQAASLPKPSGPSMVEAYWALWRHRLAERLRGTVPGPPSWPDIAWSLARNGARTLLDRGIEQRHASTWSTIAVSAITSQPASDGVTYPSSIGLFALRELGALQVASMVPETDPTLLAIMNSQKDGGERRLIVVVAASDAESDARTWAPSSVHGGIVLERKQIESIVQRLQATLPEQRARFSLQDSWLIVECSESEGRRSPEDLLDGIVARTQIAFWPVERRVQLFAREPPPSPAREAIAKVFGSPPRVIFGAHSIDEAVALADEPAHTEPAPRAAQSTSALS